MILVIDQRFFLMPIMMETQKEDMVVDVFC